MSARNETLLMKSHIKDRTEVSLTFDDANTLRKAQKTLHRWAELECGTEHCCIIWDDSGRPWYQVRNGGLYPAQNRERGALKRIAVVCQRNGLHFYHQTDPRGCALYVAREVLTDQNYSSAGVACI